MMMPKSTTLQRGAFILLEGCDRTGKSTQAEKLVAALNQRGHQARLWKFPDRTTGIGQMIHGYLAQGKDLNDQTVHLLFSANRWEAMDTLKAHLLQGTTLVVDRYAYSGVAFSAAKGLDLHWCKQPDVGLLVPDATFFLDMPIEESMKRGGFGDERYEKVALQIRVREIFHALQEPNWQLIDATQTVTAIHDNLVRGSLQVMAATKDTPLQCNLWTTPAKP
ncbi:Thymidylate kinase [Dimargaris xerosporica]|nr:Thymidylate kinase [Dimargaris xerosporica]